MVLKGIWRFHFSGLQFIILNLIACYYKYINKSEASLLALAQSIY